MQHPIKQYLVLRRSLIAALCAAMVVPTAAAESIDEFVRSQMTSRQLPGLSLAVVRNGRIVKSQGYGVASLELRAPATARLRDGSGPGSSRTSSLSSPPTASACP